MTGWPSLLDFLALRAVPGVEVVEGGSYRRSLGGRVVEVRPVPGRSSGGTCTRFPVECAGFLDHPVTASSRASGETARRLLRTLAGADEDVAAAAAHLGGHPVLGPLVRAAPGLRVPGHPDGAELAVRAILGQQVSIAGARTIAGRLTAAHGVPLAGPSGGVTHAFPAPAALAALDPEALPMPRARARALVGLCAALAAGDLDLGATADPAGARAGLLALPGIGPWTADYVLLRALRAPDVLLAGDLGVRHALTALKADTSTRALRRLADEVSPWGSYATVHLWRSLHV